MDVDILAGVIGNFQDNKLWFHFQKMYDLRWQLHGCCNKSQSTINRPTRPLTFRETYCEYSQQFIISFRAVAIVLPLWEATPVICYFYGALNITP
jgi:hypothetical protein